MVRDWDEDAPGELHQCLEGSMVFVDISGFTAMSERLAKHGKLGAEELTAVIATTFHELLAAAYSFGASLLKFGGDALLLFFAGDQHALRGCAAARAMQQRLDEVGVCVTSAGKVTLRMSVGIHSGMFDFFLVGGSHRELIVSGPAATRTVEMEGAARAGQVLLSPGTASAIPAANRGRPSGPGVLLRGAMEVESAARRHVESSPDELAQFVPIGLCQLLLSGEVEPEHRPATVAFLQYHGLDDVIERDSAEVAAERLDSLIRAVQEAVDARAITFLATDIATNGGKVILTAGVPSTTGNDEEEMLLALRRVISGGPALPISVGVTWGRVFAGEVGTPYRRTYTVMGDTVNLAARLMARAPAGEMYASAEVISGSRTTFEVSSLEPFMVKGKKFPINALSVGDPQGSKSQRATGGLPLIGRDEELDIAHRCLGESPRRATVRWWSWPPTRAWGRVASSKSSWPRRTRTGSFTPNAVSIRRRPRISRSGQLLGEVWGLTDLDPDASEKALFELVDTLAPELGPWLSLIGLALGLEIADSVEVSQLEDQFRPVRAMAAIGSLLEATMTDPVVFVVDDTHWMDEPSRDLLASLVSGMDRYPWMFVLTRSLGAEGFLAPESPSVTRVELHPLGLDEARNLIFSATEEAPLPPQQVELLARQADGNPLFLVELLQALRHSGSLEEIPQSVEAMIAARIDTLPLSDRNLLRRLSVLGNGFEMEQVSAVLGMDGEVPQDPGGSLEGLTDFLTVAESRVDFQHSLIRDVAYDGLPYKTRERLHAQVGDATFAACRGRPEEFAEILSLHYFYAKRWSRTWRFSRMAGDRAREIYANHEAAAFYERALISARHLDWVTQADRADVLTAMARVLYEAGSFDDAITSLREAARFVDDPVARADLRLSLARCYQKMGALSQALRETALGLKQVEGRALPEARRATARLRAFRTAILSDQLRPRMALKVGLQAVEEAEASGEMDALARAYTKIDEAYQILGLRDEAVHEEKALEIFEELGDLSGILLLAINLGVQAYADGRWEDAITMYAKAQEVSRRSGNVAAEGAAAANLGEVLISRGQLDEAETVLQEARRVLRGQKVIGFALFAETQLARLMMERGDTQVAANALKQVIDEANRIGQPFFAVDAAVHLADALTRSGDPDHALEVIDVAKDQAGEDAALYEVPLERLRAGALIVMGRSDEALHHVEPALASAREQRLVHEEALLLLLKAQTGLDQGDVFEEANRLLEDLGASRPYDHRLPSPML